MKVVRGLLATILLTTLAWAEANPDHIMVKEDLVPVIQTALRNIREAQKVATENQQDLEQALRITLDRAGVKPKDFNRWNFNEEAMRLEKAPGKTVGK